MIFKTKATIKDLARVPEHGKAELVSGELFLISPAGGHHNVAAGEIYVSLRAYAKRTRTGTAFCDNAGFVVNLPSRKSFSPDAAFYTGPVTASFLQGSPVFAVEVRSEGDYGPAAEQAMADKRADYFAAGTKVVWDVDLESETVVRSFQAESPSQPTCFRRGEMANAEPALPGWVMNVDDLFG